MNLNRNILMKTKSLLKFFVICHYSLKKTTIKHAPKNVFIPVNFNSIDLVNDENCISIFTDKIKNGKKIECMIGLLISSSFGNGCEQKDNINKLLKIREKIINVVYKQSLIYKKEKKIYSINFKLIRLNIIKPLYVESNYNIICNRIVYNSLESCFWLDYGFNAFFYLRKYYEVFNLNFKDQNKPESFLMYKETSSKQKISDSQFLPLRIYMCNNYCIAEQHENSLNNNNRFQVALLNYTVLRLALRTYKFDTSNISNETKLNKIYPDTKTNLENKDENLCSENDNLKIFDVCIIAYEKINSILDSMNIRTSNNIFAMFYLLRKVFKFLKAADFYTKDRILTLYNRFFSNIISIDIFDKTSFITKKVTKHKNPRVNIISDENPTGLDIQNFENFNIEKIDLAVKQIVANENSIISTFECEDKLILDAILLINALKAILTSVASYITTTEFIYHLSKTCLQLNLQNNNNNIFTKDNTEFCFYNYSSRNFQKVIEETIKNDALVHIKPRIFHYTFYIFCSDKEKITFSDELTDEIQNDLHQILLFSDTFLQETKNMANVFVFNIVFINYFLVRDIINTKHENEYTKKCEQLLVQIKEFLKTFKLPTHFVILNDNSDLNQDTETLGGLKIKEILVN
ncbi:hypothetical protein COBT_000775 [Conglomerata obtusa]